MSDVELEILASIDENMRQIKELLKLANLPEIRSTFTEELEDDWELYLYESLDGESSTRELAADLPVSRITAMNRLKSWRDQGMVRQEKQGRYQKVLSLDSLGIEVPSKGELEDDEE